MSTYPSQYEFWCLSQAIGTCFITNKTYKIFYNNVNVIMNELCRKLSIYLHIILIKQ